MVYFGFDYVTQIGTLAILLSFCAGILWFWKRVLFPMVERAGMVERVRMAMYDKELQKFCIEEKIDYSKIDVNFKACYKSGGKLKKRLAEIENDIL